MSHLKKLSERLKKVPIVPRIHEIIKFGTPNDSTLTSTPVNIKYLNRKIEDLIIPSLKQTAAANGLSSLSAPQIGHEVSLFVLYKHLIPGQWYNYTANPEDYICFANPMVLNLEKPEIEVEDWEFNPSTPDFKARISRPTEVCVYYLNEESDKVEENYTDFTARVISQQIDQCWGLLILNYSIHKGKLTLDNENQEALEQINQKFNTNVESNTCVLEDRYEIDNKFKKQADSSGNVEDFIFNHIVDRDFEDEYLSEIRELVKQK